MNDSPSDRAKFRVLLMQGNELFVQAELESRQRTAKAQEILRELMAATIAAEKPERPTA